MKHEHERIVKDRRRLARKISLELLGPIVGKMPKSSIESLEKHSYLPNIAQHILEILPVTDAQVVRHEVQAEYPAFIRKEAVFGRRKLYLLKDAVVSPHSGMAWIENRILEESVGSLRRIMDWGDMLHEPLLPVGELGVPEPVVVCHPAAGYYHWLLEVLPNLLFSVSKFPEVRFLLPEHCPDYVRHGLVTAFGASVRERFVFSSMPVRVDTLVMPQYHHVPEFTSPQVLELLRREVKAKVVNDGSGEKTAGDGEKIYISRRRSRRRRLGGEEQLEERLAAMGFDILHLEELSFEEQIRAFHAAEIVVATHGAGLSNLAWSEVPCRVIEIFPKNYILDCFSWLSFSLGLDYRYVLCSTGHRINEEAIEEVLQLAALR